MLLPVRQCEIQIRLLGVHLAESGVIRMLKCPVYARSWLAFGLPYIKGRVDDCPNVH